jgi:maltose O-acetyltransferase
MYDYESLTLENLETLIKDFNMKLMRWIAVNHPDNSVRHFLLRKTNVAIGEDSVVNYNTLILDCYKKLVTIGNRVAIASNVTIVAVSDPNNSRLKDQPYIQEKLIEEGPVVIKDDAWIGANVTILPNVTIGERSVVGAGSVVTSDIPPDTICAGAPCRLVRKLNTFDCQD